MKLPNQARPVFRTAMGLIKNSEQPNAVVDITQASLNSKLNLITDLIAGANYNAPMRFLTPVDAYGCHILSESSMAMCLDACGLL